MADFETTLAAAAKAVETVLDQVLPKADEGPEGQLFAAMRYAALAGGKRLRPFMVLASAEMFDIPQRSAVRVGAAVELMHTYSLIHDDLPCMDDDDLRRGQPTVHVAFDEATAVLAGDALQALAFEVLADEAVSRNARIRAELVLGLARATGGHGMVGGQMLDLLGEHQKLTEPAIVRMQRLKTGEMIAFAVETGAVMSQAREAERHALRAYAHDLGLAFQIADDLLDVTGTAETVGKGVNKDAAAGKATFVSLLGEAAAAERAGMLAGQAITHLETFGPRADSLRALAEFVINRRA